MKTSQIQNRQTIKESLLVFTLLIVVLLFPLASSLHAASPISECTDDSTFDFDRPNANQYIENASRVYVRVNADRPQNIVSMELFINDQSIRTEFRNPYEWGKQNSTNDPQLRNMRSGTYSLTVRVLDNCGDYHEKARVFHVGSNNNDINNIDLIPFKIRIKTDTPSPGFTDDNQFKVEMGAGLNGIGMYSIDCNSDGVLDARNVRGRYTCEYETPDEYIVSIYARDPRVDFNYKTNDRKKVLNIEQWGDGKWRSMRGAFAGCTNLTSTALDIPDLSNVRDMRQMFTSTKYNNPRIARWDVHNATKMSHMFEGATAFNQDISYWDVSNVTTMRAMFKGATAFNQNIGYWNVGKLSSTQFMFKGALAFNQDIGGWDVSNLTFMESMFEGATAFNQDIGDWNTGKVAHMSSMFKGATTFNQAIGDWNTANVRNMNDMFRFSRAFNHDIGNWDVGNVTTMKNMFKNAWKFNQDITDWNVGNVTNMSGMFYRALAFDKNIGKWDVSSVTDMNGMLSKAGYFTNYGKVLRGWSEQPLQSGVTFDTDSRIKVFSGGSGHAAREKIKRDFGWTINDGGEKPFKLIGPFKPIDFKIRF